MARKKFPVQKLIMKDPLTLEIIQSRRMKRSFMSDIDFFYQYDYSPEDTDFLFLDEISQSDDYVDFNNGKPSRYFGKRHLSR